MKTFKISKTVGFVLLIAALTVSVPMVVAYGQKKEAAAPNAAAMDPHQLMVEAKSLPIIQVDEPY